MFDKNNALKRSVDIIRRFHSKELSFESYVSEIRKITGLFGEFYSSVEIKKILPILTEYFYQPTKSVDRIIRSNNDVGMDEVFMTHKIMRESFWVKHLFTSLFYPRQLLMVAARNFVAFMERRPGYIEKLLSKDIVGPMILEKTGDSSY